MGVAWEVVRAYNRLLVEGGPGSGHHGHSGRPGEVGGSAPMSIGKPSSAEAKRLLSSYSFFKKKMKGAIHNIYDDQLQKGISYNHKTIRKFGADVQLSVLNYVHEDAEPIGKVGKALEKVIEGTKPLSKDIVSYRGLRLEDKVFKQMRIGAVVSLGRPASFTNNQGVAWDFAKNKGFRSSVKGVPIVLACLIPKGSKTAILNMAFGVGIEHVVSGKEGIVIHSVSKFRDGYKVEGEMI